MSKGLVTLCTLPPADAERVSRVLVEERLAACVNLVPQVRSIYRWNDQICDDGEVLAIIKTTAERFEALRERLVELHPYECPEVLALDVASAHAPYASWLASQVEPV